MAFKFYIDGQLTDDPIKWAPVTLVKRDRQLHAQLITQELTIEYSATNDLAPGTISGYAYLKNLFDTGVCQEAEIEIIDQISPSVTRRIHNGVIKIPQVEVQEQTTILNTKIQDNSFYSYINNNKDIKVDFRAVKSKNGVDIAPLVPYQIDLFDSYTGVFGSSIGTYYRGYRAVDVIAFIIQVITDGQVGFRSDYFDGMIPEPFIIKGQSILNPFTDFPNSQGVYEISFAEWFQEMDVCKNLSFYIDNSDPLNPVFRLEDTESTYNSALTYTFDEPLHVKTSVNTDNLYGTVATGSNITADGQDDILYPWNEATSYFGWKQESFYPLGQCNTNIELNLVSRWVLSNNVIQEVVYGQSDSYLDDYFLIECEQVDPNALTAVAYRYDFFGQPAPPYFYNTGLNNFNKLKRHSEKFEQSFGTFLGQAGGRFRAYRGDNNLQDAAYVTAPASDPNFVPIAGITVHADYVNETTPGAFDDGNNWDNVGSLYVVPSTGDYSFTQHLEFEISGFTNAGFGEVFTVLSIIELYDSVMNLKASDSVGASYTLANGNGFHILEHTYVLNGLQTDIVIAKFFIQYLPNQSGDQNIPRTLTMLYTSYFECNGAPDSGIAIANGNLNIKKYIHEFNYAISETEWQNIIANPTSLVALVKDGTTRYGWIQELRHPNQGDALSNIKMISSSTENATA